MRFPRSTLLGYPTIAAALSGMAIVAGCGSTHTKTVTRTQTVTHVVRAHRKIIHRTRTVIAPTRTVTAPSQTTAQQDAASNGCPVQYANDVTAACYTQHGSGYCLNGQLVVPVKPSSSNPGDPLCLGAGSAPQSSSQSSSQSIPCAKATMEANTGNPAPGCGGSS